MATATLTPAEQIQQIDVQSIFEQYCTVSSITNDRKEGCKEFHSSCPWCGGNDRFSFWESGRWSCSLRSSGCGRHGSSPVWFLVDFKGLTPAQACQELGLEAGSRWKFDESMLKLFSLQDAPCEQWQGAGKDFVRRAARYLWTKGGEVALAYLRSRGLDDETIKLAQLGYCPITKEGHWFEQPLSDWGLTKEMVSEKIWQRGTVRIPPGIIIPWFYGDELWKIAVKRPEVEKGKGDYGQIVGSAEGLYNAGSVIPNSQVMMVEGEIDALSIVQTAGDLVSVVATGSTTKGMTDQWIGHLCMAAQVLQSFDPDPAGNKAANNWLRTLPNAMRYKPLNHDCNDMLTSGMDVRAWVEQGLEIASQGQGEAPISQDDHLEDFYPEFCACGSPAEQYDFGMFDPQKEPFIGFCEECWARRSESPVETIADFVSKVSDMFGGCRIQKLPIGTTLQSYLESQYPGRVIRDVEPEKLKNTRIMHLLDCVR